MHGPQCLINQPVVQLILAHSTPNANSIFWSNIIGCISFATDNEK